MNIKINEANFHYKVYGETPDATAPVIIFLHDSLGCTRLWRDFPLKISDLTGLSCISYDRQGYGRSAPFSITKREKTYLEDEAIILIKFITALNLKTVYLFGHSDGGTIALIAAALYPENVKGILTEGAHVFVENATINGIKEAITLYESTNLKQRLEKYHGDKTELVFKLWTETWLSKSFRDWNIEHYLKRISCPSLIIQGNDDEYGTLDQVECIVQHSKGSTTKLIIPNIGHTPHKEDEETVLKKSAEFINALIS